MSAPQKEEEQTQQQGQEQEQEQEQGSPSSSQEKQTQDTDAEEEEEVTAQDVEVENDEAKAAATEENKENDKAAGVKAENEEVAEETPPQQEEAPKEVIKTPAKTVTPSQTATTSASKSATKRKFDALHARNAAGELSIYEHEKTKQARASALMKTPTTKVNGKKHVTKPREFSFARPTASSVSRNAAAARDHAQAKAKPTPPPARRPLHAKRTPARASTPAPKTPAMTEKTSASRPHFAYTPYTGPLPPLTVESSFAPKNSQISDRGVRTASPATSKLTAVARKSRPASAKKAKPQSSTGKENNGVNTDDGAATNAASNSKLRRTPVKTSNTVSKEENQSAFKEKVKKQRLLAQQGARSSPVTTDAEPTTA